MAESEYFPCEQAVVVAVRGEIDLVNAEDMRLTLLRAAATPGCTCVVVDLSRVQFFDASAVRALMSAYRLLTERRRHMVLAEPSAQAARTLNALRLERTFDIYPIVEAALAHTGRALGNGPGTLGSRR
ncbi:STAS domain-containing protein [Salinactinospora qingdaonensis]|uniref:Anti-sigma factor antagonist n=1 Tax=Salinactinospora qingdaonensis TaxID=702744 RepID=A0ABP7GLX5_9ACTN